MTARTKLHLSVTGCTCQKLVAALSYADRKASGQHWFKINFAYITFQKPQICEIFALTKISSLKEPALLGGVSCSDIEIKEGQSP